VATYPKSIYIQAESGFAKLKFDPHRLIVSPSVMALGNKPASLLDATAVFPRARFVNCAFTLNPHAAKHTLAIAAITATLLIRGLIIFIVFPFRKSLLLIVNGY
jgi:hypothetical protein